MASDLNSVVLVCRLTRDPELRSLNSGNSVCSLRVAFTTSRKTPSGWEDESNYADVTVWGNQGENVARYTSKGSKIGVQGNLSWREFESQGVKRQVLEIVARQVQFLDPPSGNGGGSQRGSDVPADDVSWGGGGGGQQDFAPAGGGGQPDDDIPF